MALRLSGLLYLPLLFVLACQSTKQGAGLQPVYPELLRQAGVSGFYQFRVQLDSTGRPDPTRLQVLASPSPGFDPAVRRAVAAWRPRVSSSARVVEHTILFLVLPAGADSADACPRSGAYTVICAPRPRIVPAQVH